MKTVASIALTIAGSDSGGGAGIQADLKTMSALGVYGASVLTAVTAQNTRTVAAVHVIPPSIVRSQIETVLDDLDVSAIKIGMLANPDVIQAVADALTGFAGPIVLDPVMVAKSGDALLADDAVSALIETLLPRATVLTPNLPEAARLLGVAPARAPDDIAEQGAALLRAGPKAVLMKGGHADGPVCEDWLFTSGNRLCLSAPRLNTRNTHGTGCTLSAAIASELAKGHPLEQAVTTAHAYLQGAIAQADRLRIGHGHGPVHHFHNIWPPDAPA